MLHVALTGGIGSGKSTVARMFAERGVPVVDADEIAHGLMRRGEPAFQEIVDAFGPEFLGANGEIDRHHLGERVFAAADERRRLEAIVHPRVRQEIVRQVHHLDGLYCLIVVPLLFEAGMQDLADRVLVVDCSEQRRIERVRARSGLSEDRIRTIMKTQVSFAEHRRLADDVIINDNGLNELEGQVEGLHQRYRALAGNDSRPKADC